MLFNNPVALQLPFLHNDDVCFQINEFLVDTAAANSDFIKTVSIGKSHEGRDMRVIQIMKAGQGKPNVWIEGGNGHPYLLVISHSKK